MTSPISAITPQVPPPAAASVGLTDKAKIASAAKQFESAMLRTMLSAMEKSMAGKSSGSSMYASMRVGALADALSDAGGIGLARVLTEQLAKEQIATKGPQGSPGAAVQTAVGEASALEKSSNAARSER